MHTPVLDWRHHRGHSLPRMLADPFGAASATTAAVGDVRSWQKAFRSACTLGAMTCSAAQLENPAVAHWVRTYGVSVEVESVERLEFVIAHGILPRRIVVRGSESAAAPLRRAAKVGVGGYVVGSAGQAAVLAAAVVRRTPVVVDVTDDDDTLEYAVCCAARLELVGLRLRVAGHGVSDVSAATSTVMAKMADVRRPHGTLLTRLDLADFDTSSATPRLVARAAAAIEDAVDESCARHRFPRPAVVLSPSTTH